MIGYSPQVSLIEDEEISSFLNREYQKISISLDTVHELNGQSALPTRPTVGKLYYFKNAINGVIDEEGYYGFKSTGYVKLG